MKDWCKLMADIEANPSQKIQFKVREYLALKEHVHGCDNCYNRMERVLAKDKSEGFPDRSTN